MTLSPYNTTRRVARNLVHIRMLSLVSERLNIMELASKKNLRIGGQIMASVKPIIFIPTPTSTDKELLEEILILYITLSVITR